MEFTFIDDFPGRGYNKRADCGGVVGLIMVAFDGEFMGLKILTDFKFHEESVAGEFGEDFFDGSADAGPLEALHGHALVSGRSEEDRLGVGREEVHFGGVAGLEGEFFAEFLFGGLPEGLASQDGGGEPRSGLCCVGRGIFGVLVFLFICCWWWWGGALGMLWGGRRDAGHDRRDACSPRGGLLRGEIGFDLVFHGAAGRGGLVSGWRGDVFPSEGAAEGVDDIAEADFAEGLSGFDEADFEVEALVGSPLHAGFGIGELVDQEHEFVGALEFGLIAEAGSHFRGKVPGGDVRIDTVDEEVSEMEDEIGEEPGEVFAGFGMLIELAEGTGGFAAEDGSTEFGDGAVAGEAKNVEDILLPDVLAAEGHTLIEHRLGIPHPAVGSGGDRVSGMGIQR